VSKKQHKCCPPNVITTKHVEITLIVLVLVAAIIGPSFVAHKIGYRSGEFDGIRKGSAKQLEMDVGKVKQCNQYRSGYAVASHDSQFLMCSFAEETIKR
jgi:hypothetical protein